MTSSRKPEVAYTQRTATPSERYRATASDKLHSIIAWNLDM